MESCVHIFSKVSQEGTWWKSPDKHIFRLYDWLSTYHQKQLFSINSTIKKWNVLNQVSKDYRKELYRNLLYWTWPSQENVQKVLLFITNIFVYRNEFYDIGMWVKKMWREKNVIILVTTEKIWENVILSVFSAINSVANCIADQYVMNVTHAFITLLMPTIL